MKAKLLLSAALIAFALSSADAQSVNRSKRQHRRIQQGVRSGELTRAEAVNLKKVEREIRQEKREARADGVVTAEEKKEIRQAERQQNRKIARKKHNHRNRN